VVVNRRIFPLSDDVFWAFDVFCASPAVA